MSPSSRRAAPQKPNGIQAALAAALFLGMAPVFGKQAILAGFPPIGVVALRTGMAAGLLFAAILVFRRPYLYIYPAGLLGCLLAGGINGLGSLLYYSALGRIDASVGQLVYSLYPVFVAGWLWLDHQPPARLTLVRLSLAVPAVALLTQSQSDRVDMLGIGLMFTASILYALHLPINQRVLYEMPAPTVTLYTLLAMSVVVVGGYFVLGAPPLPASLPGWQGVFWLTLVTFLSRSLLFLGVKHLGGMQTALLGLGELLVTVVFAHLWLGERLSTLQWLGAILLGLSLVLVGFEKAAPPKPNPAQGWLRWFSQPRLPPDIP